MPRGDNNRKLDDAQIDEIVRRYTTQLPDGTWEGTVSLARDFGVSTPAVRRWLGLRGVQLRSARESHSGGKRCKPVTNLPQGDAPACRCGCGQVAAWNRRKNRWNAYVNGHRGNAAAAYNDATWLLAEYTGKGRTLAEVAAEAGVSTTVIAALMDRYQIQRRGHSDARTGRRAGALNHAWKGGVAQWPYSSDWKSLARKIRDRDKWTCQDCGERRKRWGASLHVHHIDGDKRNNDPANLISLCAQCHKNRHRKGDLGKLEAS